jgi:tetratricopeptide (TPR) repeat protein
MRIRDALAIVAAITLASALDPPRGRGQRDPRDAALDESERAHEAYRSGRYQEAVDFLRRAYELYPEPVILFDLGCAYAELGHHDAAIDAFRDYLEAAPDAPDRNAVEARIAAEEAALAREAQATRLPPDLPPDDAPRGGSGDGGLDVAPWVLVASGAVLAGLGSGFVWYGFELHDRAARAPDHFTGVGLQSDAETVNALGIAGLVVGSVALAAGLAWGIVTVATRDDRSAASTLRARRRAARRGHRGATPTVHAPGPFRAGTLTLSF